jgi:hypothetical protein
MAVDVAALRQRVHRYSSATSGSDTRPKGRSTARARSALQVLVVVAQGIERDQILLRATALTYSRCWR